MTYGSWSGGIYILELDKTTGKVIYPGKNSKTADGRVVDEYFGTKIAGGFRKSGEGPYILYDKDSDYYYLYVSYEGLAQNGGYNSVCSVPNHRTDLIPTLPDTMRFLQMPDKATRISASR